MKKRARIVSDLAALAALFLAPLAEASLTRATSPAPEPPSLTLASAPEPSDFSLFEGNGLTAAAAESERASRFHPLAAVSLISKNEAEAPLVSAGELIYPKTRYRVFGLLGTPILGELRGVSLELRWGCASFSCGLASGTVGWLSQDPMGDTDSPNLYGFVGARPHELTDPLGLMRRTANGGENALGNFGDIVNVTGTGTAILSGALDFFGNTVSDVFGLDTIADSIMVAGDSDRSIGERAWAATKGTVTAALDVAGGAILKKGLGLAARIPGVGRVGNAISNSAVGAAVKNVATREVRALAFVDEAMKAAQNSTVGRALNTDLEYLGDAAIRRSRFANPQELAAESFTRYQRYVDEAYGSALKRGLSPPPGISSETYLGQVVDRAARGRLRTWLANERIPEGPGQLVEVNRWLRDPAGSGSYRIPDFRIGRAGSIFDASLAAKSALTPQIIDFRAFSLGNRITIVRPSAVGGSYSIWP